MSIYIIGYYITHLEDIKAIFLNSIFEAFVVAGDLTVAAILLANALVIHPWELSTVYLGCLFWWLLQACFFFYVSIESLWSDSS